MKREFSVIKTIFIFMLITVKCNGANININFYKVDNLQTDRPSDNFVTLKNTATRNNNTFDLETKKKTLTSLTEYINRAIRILTQLDQSLSGQVDALRNIFRKVDVDVVNVSSPADNDTTPQKLLFTTLICKDGSGVHLIQLPDLEAFSAYCILDTNDDCPWTIVQRRMNREIDFNRTWLDYKSGFGDVQSSHFIGLNRLHHLTSMMPMQLKVVLRETGAKKFKYALYDEFIVGDEKSEYQLMLVGNYRGNAGDALSDYEMTRFKTRDRTQSNPFKYEESCAQRLSGGWWGDMCESAQLNGIYEPGISNAEESIAWGPTQFVQQVYEYVHMAIRPKH